SYQRLLQKQQVKGPGSPVYVGVSDEPEFHHKGTLVGFDNRVNPETGTVQAHATLPNPGGLLLPGMFARVRMPTGPPKFGLGVPEEVVLTDQGKHYVMVVTAKDLVERRNVLRGAAAGNMRLIEKGISADDWIVVSGFTNLRPATRVKTRRVRDTQKETLKDK